MKRKSATTFNSRVLLAACLLSATLFSCETKDGPVTETKSCVDQKDYSAPFPSKLNEINHFIKVDRGIELINNFTRNKDSILSGVYKGNEALLVNSETFNLNSIDSLLCQDEAVGFRIYTGLDEDKKMRFVIVGVDKDGNDVLQPNGKPTGLLGKQSIGTIAGATGASAANAAAVVLESGQRHP